MSDNVNELYNLLREADVKAQAGDQQAQADAQRIYNHIQHLETQKTTQHNNEFSPTVAGLLTAKLGMPSSVGMGGKMGFDVLKKMGAGEVIKNFLKDKIQTAGKPPISPTDIILQGQPNSQGVNPLQKEMGHNIQSEQMAARARAGEKLASDIQRSGAAAFGPTNLLANSPKMTVSSGGIPYPASEAYAAEAVANAPKSMGQRATQMLSNAKTIYDPVMKLAGPIAGAYQMGSEGVDAYNRYNRGDYLGSGLSALSGVAGAASLWPPAAPVAVPPEAALAIDPLKNGIF
jgi:hypothetical protein